MDLNTQIISLLFSFLYGFIFYLTLHFSTKIIYSNNLFIKIFGTLSFVLCHILCYFFVLQKINNGIVHIYLILSLSFGYMTSCVIQEHLFTLVQKR